MKRHLVYNCNDIEDGCYTGKSLAKNKRKVHSVEKYNASDQHSRNDKNECTFSPYHLSLNTFRFEPNDNNQLNDIYANDLLNCEYLGFEEFFEDDSNLSNGNNADGEVTIGATRTDSLSIKDVPIQDCNASQTPHLKDQMALNDQKIRMDEQKIRILELENTSKMLDLEQQRLLFYKQLFNRRHRLL